MKALAISLVLFLGPGVWAGDPPSPVPVPVPPAAPVVGTPRVLARPDLELHYCEYGKGQPVLLLQGGPGFAGSSLEPLAQLVGKKARAILPDCRGTGLSMPKTDQAITLQGTLEDLEALRQNLGLKQWTVLGLSWGGMVAMEYAVKFPASLDRLILLGSGPMTLDAMGALMDTAEMRMSTDEHAAWEYWNRKEVRDADPERANCESFRALFSGYFFDRAKAVQWIARMHPGKDFYNPKAGRMAAEYGAGTQARIAGLKHLKVPTLIIHGRQDPVLGTWAVEIHEMISSSRLVWIERCGHFVYIEQPEALEKTLFEFLGP